LVFAIVTKRFLRLLLPHFLLLCPVAVSHGQVTPLFYSKIMGGQYFFEGNPSSFGGTADLDAGGAFRFNARDQLFTIYSLHYKGFKDVTELVSGGTLFQQTMEHKLSLRYTNKNFNGWTLKPKASYKWEFYRETKDEKWAKGLFDLRRANAGITLAKPTTIANHPFYGAATYDFFYTIYPNYQALQSQYGAELANLGLSEENNGGTKVLDTLTNQVLLEANTPIGEKTDFELSYAFSLRNFVDQKIINSEAKYISKNRQDQVHSLNTSAIYHTRAIKLGNQRVLNTLGLSYGLLLQNSNQNHFDTDPSKLQYIPNFYDYIEHSAGPVWNIEFRPWWLSFSLSYNYELRHYTNRLTQDALGNYQTSKLIQRTHSVNFETAYAIPYLRGLSARAVFQWRNADSNTLYQQVYRYDYVTMTYFGGLSYEF